MVAQTKNHWRRVSFIFHINRLPPASVQVIATHWILQKMRGCTVTDGTPCFFIHCMTNNNNNDPLIGAQFLSSFMVICHVCHKDNQWSQLYRRAACKNILACLSGYEWWIHETLKNFHRRETSIFPYTKKKMKKKKFFFILSMLSHLSRFTAAVEHKSVDNEQSIEHGTQLWSYLT